MLASRIPVVAFAVLWSACAPAPEPKWAQAHPASARSGEATIDGAALAVPRARQAPTVDGRLDDPAWSSAAEAGPFVDPGDGSPASPNDPVSGFARLCWTTDYLFVGAVVRDRRPSSPFGRDDTDPHIWSRSSGIELMLQPGDFGDNRDYFEIQVDSAGAVFDTRWDDYNRPITGTGEARTFGHQDWSASASRAVEIVKRRLYAVEVAIPWRAFGPARVSLPPKPGDTWRVNMYTFRDGQHEALAWSPIRRQGNFHRANRFGRITFSD